MTTTNGSASTSLSTALFEQLNQANKLLVDSMHTDAKYPDLYDQVTDTTEPHNYYFEPYLNRWQPQLVVKDGRIPIPNVIETAFDGLKSCLLMGIFPEIHHAWTTVDNKLFLWDYTKKETFAEFDQVDQLICGVGLVKPRRDVFKDFVQYALVVATATEVKLLGVVFEDGDEVAGRMSLHNSELCITTDNISFSRILGTPDGRIFMGGTNGYLYEFVYQNNNQWLVPEFLVGKQRNCAKKNRSLGYVQDLFNWTSQHPVIEMVLDNDRSILYVLNSHSTIHVFDISTDVATQVAEVNVFESAVAYCKEDGRNGSSFRGAAARPDRSHFVQSRSNSSQLSIQSISIVSKHESTYIHLLAISKTGVRFYLTTLNSKRFRGYSATEVRTTQRPSTLRVIHIRFPPPTVDPASMVSNHPFASEEGLQPSFIPGKSAEPISMGYYSKGVLLMAESVPDKHDRVVNIAQDLISRSSRGGLSTTRTSAFRESISCDELHGKIWQIDEHLEPHLRSGSFASRRASISCSESSTEESNTATPASSSLKRSYHNVKDGAKNNNNAPVAMLSEFSTQYFLPQRHILCLTSSGLNILTKLRPMDHLHTGLLHSTRNENDRKLLGMFFDYYGQVETCAMLFGIACGLSSSSYHHSADKASISSLNHHVHHAGNIHQQEQIRAEAIRVALEYGGRPGVADYMPSAGESSSSIQRLIMTDDMYMSGHHDGMVMFVSRVLLPFWNHRIVKLDKVKTPANNSNTNERTGCQFSSSELTSIREVLFQLKQILEQTMPYSSVVHNPMFCTSSSRDGPLSQSQNTEPSRANVMTRQLQRNQFQKTHEYAHQEKALKAEQRSIYSLYTLVSRAIQGFSLCLLCYDRPVAWSEPKIIRLTFRELITTDVGISGVRGMVDRLMKDSLKQPLGSSSIESFVESLRNQCSVFFSVGDVWQYQGLKKLDTAQKELSRARRQELLEETHDQFLKASRHWQDLETLASTLTPICEQYTAMGYFEGVVELALTCAMNFSVNRALRSSSPEPITPNTNNWFSPKSRTTATSILSLSSNNATSTCASTRLEQARLACYQNIFNVLSILLQQSSATTTSADTKSTTDEAAIDEWLSLPQEKKQMLSRQTMERALASKDQVFHHQLYLYLLTHNHEAILVGIRSPYIEEFLKHQNSELLSNFYVRQQRYSDAALVMWTNAHVDEIEDDHHGSGSSLTTNSNPSISERVGYLTRALSYAQSAAAHQGKGGVRISMETVKEIEAKMDVFQLQASVLSEVKTLDDSTSSDIETLMRRMVDISTLYNQYAVKYKLWDQCLAIIHSCQTNEPQIIRRHWQQIIYSIVPAHSYNSHLSAWIRERKEECNVANIIATSSSMSSIEDMAWIGTLQQRLRKLGRLFYHAGNAPYVFPVSEIAQLLEELWMKFTTLNSAATNETNHWILQLFEDVEISHRVMFQTYEQMYHDRDNTAVWQIHLAQSLCYIVTVWKDEAVVVRSQSEVRIEFADACPNVRGVEFMNIRS